MIANEKIYLIGIGGIGMSGLARIYKISGHDVSGSDLLESQTTQELKKFGIKVFLGHSAQQLLGESPDAVVYSADITEQSPGFLELEAGRKQDITVWSYAEALGKLMGERKHGIAVTGTNGKSTTTAMLGLILDAAKFDPMVLVGTKISPKNENEFFRANARYGLGHCVMEADEYQRKMLSLKPNMIVLTNVAEDHLDYYKDLADIKSAFIDFVRALPKDGVLIFNADDHNTVEVAHHAACHKFSFGIHHYADLQALNIKLQAGRQVFDLHLNDQLVGTFELGVPGRFNILNALGASLAAIKLDVSPETIKQVLGEFAGTWRRFEKVGELGGKTIISDYGHHPAAIAATLEAVEEFYLGKTILLVFQPHHRNRTKKLFGEFVEALAKASDLIIPEIFEVAGREHGENISSNDLVLELNKLGAPARYAKDLEQTEQMVRERVKDFDIVILMGAGDIDVLARKLCK